MHKAMVIVVAVNLAACGGSGGSGSTTGAGGGGVEEQVVCAAGEHILCECEHGPPGAATCSDAGTALGPCSGCYDGSTIAFGGKTCQPLCSAGLRNGTETTPLCRIRTTPLEYQPEALYAALHVGCTLNSDECADFAASGAAVAAGSPCDKYLAEHCPEDLANCLAD